MSTQTTDSLIPHRVTLVSHSAAPDLGALERLFDLLQIREQAEIRGDLVCSST